MTGTWNECPLMTEYIRTKRNYMKELRLEEWRKRQRAELLRVISIAINQVDEPRKEYWIDRLYFCYCRRLRSVTGCEWTVFLGELSDEGAYGMYENAKARKYCLLVRDTAWQMTRRISEPKIAACEEIFEYRFAA